MSNVQLEKWLILCLAASMMLTTGFVVGTERYAEPGFFEFALLGPGMKASDYPFNVTVTQTITLLVFVASRMPGPERVRITMSAGSPDLQTEELPVVAQQELELLSQQNRTVTFQFTLLEFGFTENGAYRVVFELYRSAHSSASPWSYTGLWLQIWLNARE